MPTPADTGQYRGTTPIPSISTRTLRSATRFNTPATSTLSQAIDHTQFPTPAEATATANATSPSTSTSASPQSSPAAPNIGKPMDTTATALHKISTALAQVLDKYKLPNQVKSALSEILVVAKKANIEDEREKTFVPASALKQVHDVFKDDLVFVSESLDLKLTEILSVQKKLLADTERLCTSTRDIESKVIKVNDTTDKLATTTKSYRDAIIAKPADTNRNLADPKVLDGMERKARQILVGFSTAEDNDTLQTSLSELIDKANSVISEIDDPLRPESASVVFINRNRDNSLLLLLNSKETADWLREPDVEDKFVAKFAPKACFRERSYSILLRWVPIIFDPNDRKQLREIEEVNGLAEYSVQKSRWIKPVGRRNAGQTKANATISVNSPDTANRIIKSGLDICGVRCKAERTKQEPLQCLKCRGWGHKALDCKAEKDTCGTCGKEHRTSDCNDKKARYCVSCKSVTHASWDRTCPEFLHRCELYNDRFPENSMLYFPTDQDWTLTTRPCKIPVENRFPARYAVNSLPTNTRGVSSPTVRLPVNNKTKAGPSTQLRPGYTERVLNRSQPNLVPLGRVREEGELPDPAEHDTTLEHQEAAAVEDALDWALDPPFSPSMIGGCHWDQQPTGW